MMKTMMSGSLADKLVPISEHNTIDTRVGSAGNSEVGVVN